ncbi:MAG TPA: hypothetical protein VEA69_07230 [Tepidisphaeraceae bacterium]|nr:hypothetical protein [Tepidisphaeraceae bacterium]
MLALLAMMIAGTSVAVAAPPVKPKDPKGKPAPVVIEDGRYRTDADPADSKLPWFRVSNTEFPPEGSAHYLAGELIAGDHINRVGVLRPDRTDAQRRGDWDVPLPFVLLPYGSVSYHGSPADLRDVPIGTHLHGQFYVWGDAPKPESQVVSRRTPIDAAFGRVLKLEDDFSYSVRTGRAWRVNAVALDTNTVTVTGVDSSGKADAKPTLFQISPATRVWKGRGVGALADLVVGQPVILNLTVCTLKGPGRVTDAWVDAESRQIAAAQQVEIHRQHLRERGLAARIDAVDNAKSLVTVTFFGGVDPALIAEFKVNEGLTLAVAEDSLRTYDQINDRKPGTVTLVESVPVQPGSSGVRVTFKAGMLLEGVRPKRILRLWAGKWKVDDLPLEERLYP